MMIMPYVKMDGIPTFKDSFIGSIYDQMVIDGTARNVFIDGQIKTRADFTRQITCPTTISHIPIVDNKPVGIGWVNRIEYKKGYGHFALLKDRCDLDSVEIGTKLVGSLITLKKLNGENMFDVLIGFCPVANKLAIRFMKKCGGHSVGIIPQSVFNIELQHSVDAEMFYFLRSDYEDL